MKFGKGTEQLVVHTTGRVVVEFLPNGVSIEDELIVPITRGMVKALMVSEAAAEAKAEYERASVLAAVASFRLEEANKALSEFEQKGE